MCSVSSVVCRALEYRWCRAWYVVAVLLPWDPVNLVRLMPSGMVIRRPAGAIRPNGRPAHQRPRGLPEGPGLGPMLGGHLPPGLERTPQGHLLHQLHGAAESGPRAAADSVAAALPDDVFGSEEPMGGPRGGPEQLPAEGPKAGSRGGVGAGGGVGGGGVYGNPNHGNPGQGSPGQAPRQDGSGSARRGRGGTRGSGGRGSVSHGNNPNPNRAGGRGGRGLADMGQSASTQHMGGGGHSGGTRRHGSSEDGAPYEMQTTSQPNNPVREGGQGRGGGGVGRGRAESGRSGGRGRGRERVQRGAHAGQGLTPNPIPGPDQAHPRPQWLPLPPKAVT